MRSLALARAIRGPRLWIALAVVAVAGAAFFGLYVQTGSRTSSEGEHPTGTTTDTFGEPREHQERTVAEPRRGGTDAEILLGISAAFRGPSRGLGIELYRGAMAYIAHINANGGVKGRQIVVRLYDDNYNPDPAIQNTVRLIEDDKVLLLFNYVGTPTVTRVLPLLKMYKTRDVLLFFPFTGAQPHREPPYGEYVFNLRASYRQETEGFVERFARIRLPRIAVFHQADAYGFSGLDGVKRALHARGLKPVAAATYARGSSYKQDFGRQVAILREAAPDAIIAIGAYAACAGFVRDARNAGWNVPIANVSFVGSENLLGLLTETERASGKVLTRNLINSQVVPSYEELSLPAIGEYRSLMDKHAPAPPDFAEPGYVPLRYSFVSLEGFLNAKVLVEILRRMGDKVGDKTRVRETAEGIRDLDLGINALASFGPARHQGLDAVYYTVARDGKFMTMTADDWQALTRK